MGDDLDRILNLADRARIAEVSAMSAYSEGRIETHAKACGELWDELYRQLDARAHPTRGE